MRIGFYFYSKVWHIIKRMLASPKFKVIEPFGEMKYEDRAWFADVSGFYPDRTIEIGICVNDVEEDVSEKVQLIQTFMEDCDALHHKLCTAVFERYRNTIYAKTHQEIEKMYFLSSVTITTDHSWWLVLEPYVSVETFYNYFVRFTMVDGKIVWMNI